MTARFGVLLLIFLTTMTAEAAPDDARSAHACRAVIAAYEVSSGLMTLQRAVRNATDAPRPQWFDELRSETGDLTKAAETRLFPVLGESARNPLQRAMGDLHRSVETILAHGESRTRISDALEQLMMAAPLTQARLDDVAQTLMDLDQSKALYFASMAVVLVDRLMRRGIEASLGGYSASSVVDGMRRDAGLYGRIMAALKDGDETLGIPALADEAARELLASAASGQNDLLDPVHSIADAVETMKVSHEEMEMDVFDSLETFAGTLDAVVSSEASYCH